MTPPRSTVVQNLHSKGRKEGNGGLTLSSATLTLEAAVGCFQFVCNSEDPQSHQRNVLRHQIVPITLSPVQLMMM